MASARIETVIRTEQAANMETASGEAGRKDIQDAAMAKEMGMSHNQPRQWTG